jgi:hypothetical protein
MRDSRLYRFPLLIGNPAEWLDGFAPPAPDFRLAVFLPQDDPDWFGRSSYPPRIVVLGDRRIVVCPLLGAGETGLVVPFDTAFELETGRFLLVGWMRFSSANASCRLGYNTRVAEPVENFLRQVRAEAFQIALRRRRARHPSLRR